MGNSICGSCCCAKDDTPNINIKTDVNDAFKFKCPSSCCNPVFKSNNHKHKKRNSKDKDDRHHPTLTEIVISNNNH